MKKVEITIYESKAKEIEELNERLFNLESERRYGIADNSETIKELETRINGLESELEELEQSNRLGRNNL